MSTGKNLIFLISQPRSGSTLLQKILAGHSSIHTVSEPWIALHPLLALRQRGVSHYHSHALAREATLDFLSYVPGGEDTYFDSVRLMLSHLYEAALAPSGKSLFLDKTPRYYFILPELRRVFPDARFIFLIRNPLATFASILESWVKEPLFASRYAFRTDLLHDIFTAPAQLIAAMEAPSPNDAFVSYEALVQAPALHIERLCNWLGVSYEPRMIDYGAHDIPHWSFGDQNTVYTEHRPITGRTERWRQTLRPDTAWNELACSYLSALGQATVERLGYDYGECGAALAASRYGIKGAPPFLQTSVMTAAYGESCDYLSQSTYFQTLLDRLAIRRPQVKPAAQEQKSAHALPSDVPRNTGSPDADPAVRTTAQSA